MSKQKVEVTYSRLSTFLKCPMLEYYQYRVNGRGIKLTAPYAPFIEGELGHYALHFFHKSGRMLRANLINRVDELIAEAGNMEPEAADTLKVKLAALIGACLGYKQVYAGDKNKYKTLLTEEPFEFVRNGVTFRGKIDRLSQDKETKKIILWENKFLMSATAQNYVALPMDLQGMLYCEGVKSLTGKYPDLKAWDFIIKSQLRRKKDKQGGRESLATFEARVQDQYIQESDKKFFRPPPIRVYKSMLSSLGDELEKILSRFTGNEVEMNFTNCLGMYGQPCPYIQACTEKLLGHADGWDAPACQGLYKMKDALHEELEKTKSKAEKEMETEKK